MTRIVTILSTAGLLITVFTACEKNDNPTPSSTALQGRWKIDSTQSHIVIQDLGLNESGTAIADAADYITFISMKK